MASTVYLKGMDRLLKEVDQIGFSKPQKIAFLRKVSRPAAKVIQAEVKRLIPTPKKADDFPYIGAIRRGVKTRASKSRISPGSVVVMQGDPVPVSPGKNKAQWSLRGYSMLVFFGNKDTRNRPHKTGMRKGNVRGQGNVKGILGFHPFARAAVNKGDKALRTFSFSIKKKILKDWY